MQAWQSLYQEPLARHACLDGKTDAGAAAANHSGASNCPNPETCIPAPGVCCVVWPHQQVLVQRVPARRPPLIRRCPRGLWTWIPSSKLTAAPDDSFTACAVMRERRTSAAHGEGISRGSLQGPVLSVPGSSKRRTAVRIMSSGVAETKNPSPVQQLRLAQECVAPALGEGTH
jgi:hypothetical protein